MACMFIKGALRHGFYWQDPMEGYQQIGPFSKKKKRYKYVNKLLSVSVFILLFLLGCASTKYRPSSSGTYPHTSSAAVYYFKPDRPYMEMGTIKVKAYSETGMFEKFKQKAMEIGADGVFITSMNNQLTFDNHIWFLVVAPIRAEGVLIKFKDTSLEK